MAVATIDYLWRHRDTARIAYGGNAMMVQKEFAEVSTEPYAYVAEYTDGSILGAASTKRLLLLEMEAFPRGAWKIIPVYREPPKDDDDGEDLGHLIELWNKAPGVKACRKSSPARTSAFRSRMKDRFWRANWRAAIARLPLKCWSDKSWTPTIEWFLRPDTVLKIIEGRYDFEPRKQGAF